MRKIFRLVHHSRVRLQSKPENLFSWHLSLTDAKVKFKMAQSFHYVAKGIPAFIIILNEQEY